MIRSKIVTTRSGFTVRPVSSSTSRRIAFLQVLADFEHAAGQRPVALRAVTCRAPPAARGRASG